MCMPFQPTIVLCYKPKQLETEQHFNAKSSLKSQRKSVGPKIHMSKTHVASPNKITSVLLKSLFSSQPQTVQQNIEISVKSEFTFQKHIKHMEMRQHFQN